MRLLIALAFACLFAATTEAATIHSKAGAHASVSSAHAVQFQALIDDLEAHGATIRFMGGWRADGCSQRHKHGCGEAVDLCQYDYGVVDPRCHLPKRAELNQIAASHGLFSGGAWCHSDHGHVEAGGSWPCSGRHYVVYHEHRPPRVLPHPILIGAM